MRSTSDAFPAGDVHEADILDLLGEERISLTQLAREQDVSASTAVRWCQRGVRGVALESFRVGGRRYTTRPAFLRWMGRVSAAVNGEPPRRETDQRREAAINRAEKELRDCGV